MNLRNIVAVADAERAFVSSADIECLKKFTRLGVVRLRVAQELATHADQMIQSALQQLAHQQTDPALTALADLALRYLSYQFIADASLLEVAGGVFQPTFAELKTETNVNVMLALLKALEQAVNQFILNPEAQDELQGVYLDLTPETEQYFKWLSLQISQMDTHQHQVFEQTEPLWQRLVSLGQQISEEEWAKLPTDLSQNFEHYMYGSPKE